MAFSISLMGHFSSDYFDEYDNKSIKQTAQGWITREQIQNCYKGKAFHYSDFHGNIIMCDGLDRNTFNYYYNVFSNTKEFGLPNGKGWIGERQSILSIIKAMNAIYDKTIEMKRLKR